MNLARSDFLFKFVLIGDTCAKKTRLLQAFTDAGTFSEKYVSTIGIDFVSPRALENCTIKTYLYRSDGGLEQFRESQLLFFLCCDISQGKPN